MGGGGGAGDANSNPTQGGAGGKGGGIVFMTVYGTISGTGNIEANGAAGQNANPLGQAAVSSSAQKFGNDAAGGAGGGGVVAIANGTAIPATVTLSATGGTGGNQVISFGAFVGAPTMEADGPGGGGAGGMIAFTSGTPVQNVGGGANGVTNSSHVNLFPPNGATMGASGTTALPQSFFNITGTDVTICPNTSTTLTAAVTGTLPGGATLTWYSTRFGSVVLGTGATYTTGTLSATTTYYVGTCPGTFRIPVVVTVGSGPVITGTLLVAEGSTTQLTGSGTPAASSPWISGTTSVGTISSTGLVTGVTTGTTTITYTNSSGCLVTAVVTVTSPLPVELLYFTAELNERKTVDMTWATASETNNDYFVTEKSADLETWMPVNTVDGSGTSFSTVIYAGEDSAPFYGISYYRLKQVDLNGSVKHSPIEAVALSGSGTLVAYPNPAGEILHLTGEHMGDKTMTVFNSVGQQVDPVIVARSDEHFSIDTRLFPNGIYYLRIVSNTETAMLKIEVLHR